MKRVPVLICGGGSVGLSLAAELGWRGVECLTVERMDGLNMHPRANAVANRTMEYYRRWGIDGAISDAGVPPDLPANYYYITTLAGRILHGINLPPFRELNKLAAAKGGYAASEHGWSPYLKTITGQHEVEKVLLDYVQSRESIDFRFGYELRSFEDTGDGVVCRIARTGEVAEEEVLCDYLVGCDGGKSMIRRELGIDLKGRSNLADFVSFYFRAPELMQCHDFGHANIFFPLHRDHRGFLLNWDGGTTFTYHVILDEGTDWRDVDAVKAVQGLVDQETPVEVISTQPWTAHALVAEQYGKGRVFLAGDAAHLFTPTGGFGMNTGVSDVIDLGWRLQAGLEGWAGSGLFDSYTQERQPIGVRNTSEAADCFDRLFAVMQEGDDLDDDGPIGDEVRSRLKGLIEQQEKLIVSSGTLLGYRYSDSAIVVPDGSPEPDDHPRNYVPTARPGHRAPHLWLQDGRSILDLFGAGFTLLIFAPAGSEANISPLITAATAAGLPLSVSLVEDAAAATLYEASYVLVRPDLMVAWRSDTPPDNAADIIERVRGAAQVLVTN
ncbi:MAG: 2-polyprenyl-6-methoxyphenol hydroxylase [Alphaproteobacteria bacterium]|jgi:2-polyprenyl-6-methoxyphenol hydroxylase-like FAD-dependent oxidoreductase|nr:2-polyprenyl-6-methoxyphenol hydroxylase [Alphaproteobacteria bacterium]MBT4965995.1 2-polyprenyl-6-methoxyphenol hydroxylase [Alphaproteobacteria bacterium]MBT5160877.1 2-polyprenyl-6-methoxyphenol hydroxylase [Alphaproteobacteria bacterium]MBT5918263.1 2-polyprenyl-6-methoxyphenol hydroxylase [Alphaproteobacteria bacterium]MBT6385188.1 2-polyprenyl-6-methoxyphenol hydroxylase [Alphaproteobacteria bacterium]